MLGIKWQDYVSDEDVLKRANLPSLVLEKHNHAGNIIGILIINTFKSPKVFCGTFFGDLSAAL
jgi:hypothetical protein